MSSLPTATSQPTTTGLAPEERLQIIQHLCGVDLQTDFLVDLDTLLRGRLHDYRMLADRHREMSNIGAARCVKQVSGQYETQPASLPLPLYNNLPKTNALPPTAATNPQQQQQHQRQQRQQPPNAATAARLTELRALRTNSLVSSMASSFRSRLESIVGSQVVPNAPNSRSPATPRAGSQQQHHQPQHHTAATITAPAVPISDIRQPDEPFMDQLLPNNAGAAMYQFTDEEQNSQQELMTLMQFQVATRVLSSHFRNTLEGVLREQMVRENLAPTRLSLPRSTRPPAPAFAVPQQRQQPRQQPQPNAQPEPQPQHVQVPAGLPLSYGMSRDSALWQVSQDMSWLRAQMEETRALANTSLTMQLEMQRTLTQEVSALFELIRSSHPSLVVPAPVARTDTSNNSSGNSNDNETMGKCVVCAEQPADVVFFRCGHQCSCVSCATQFKSQNKCCPICRAPIQHFVRCFPAWC